MAEEPTYEEAKRCPKCQEPGEKTKEEVARRVPGARLHTIHCRNSRCSWYNTPYIIQVNPDGTIPRPDAHKSRLFPSLPPRSDADVERANAALLNSTLHNGEIR